MKPTLFSFPPQFVKEHYRKGYQTQHWLQKKIDRDFIQIDLEDYYVKLREQLVQLLIDKHMINRSLPLESLHEHINDELKAYGNDGIGKLA